MGWLSVVETLDPVSWIKLCSVPRSNGICDSFEDEKKTKSIWKRDLPGIIDLRKLFEFAGGSTREAMEDGLVEYVFPVENGGYSIVMLVYQRVSEIFCDRSHYCTYLSCYHCLRLSYSRYMQYTKCYIGNATIRYP